MIRSLLGFNPSGSASSTRGASLWTSAVALLSLLLAGSAAVAQSQSGFTYNGVVYTSYQANEYQQTPQGPQGAAAIRATGANYTSVLVTQYQQTATSTTIAPETTGTPGYNPSADPLSPTDASVVSAIQNLQAQGLTVVLKPQVDSLDGTFRALFAPTDPTAWFASYQTFMLHYAQLAAQNNVGVLIIGTELKSLSGSAYKTNWNNLIAQIRTSYPSLTLAYGANATGSTDEFTTVSFWDKVDIIGVDGYFPLTNHPNPTVAELVAAWTGNKYSYNIVAALKALQSQYNKPLIFTELGYVSATDTNEMPYSLAVSGAAYDPTEQQNCYEAFFEVFSQQTAWMKGVFWWAWSVSPPAANDLEYTPQNKPAGTVTLPKWFGSTTPGFTLAPSNAILAVTDGFTSTDTISVTNLGGFSGAVALSASGLPSGVTASFAAGTGAGTQLLTLTATGAAASGPATVTITGTSGALTASTTVALAVQGSASQTITFTNPGAQHVGTPLALVATTTSGLPVTFSTATPTVCTVASTTATFLTSGTCTLNANQAGNTAYSPAPQVQQSFSVSPAANFSLSPTSAQATVTQGSSIADTITITPTNGFNGSVTLSATALPSGVTATFATNPTSATSVLTLAASSSATTGSATITLVGSSGSVTSSTTLSLTVNPPTSFTLAPTATSLSIAQGGSVTDTVTITGVGGFSGSVALAVSSLPSGITSSFATNPATATSVLTLTAGSAAASGTTTITVVGTSGSLTATTPISLTITTPAGLSISPSSSTLSVTRGASVTDTLSLAPAGGFTGSVALTAAVTSSPAGAQLLPVLSFGASSPATVTNSGGSATLTISTTAPTTAFLARPARQDTRWGWTGGIALSGLLLIALPGRRRKGQALPKLLTVVFFGLLLTGGLAGCSGGGPAASTTTSTGGTTAGSYTVTVTATSGAVVTTLPLTLTVQ